MRLRFLQKFLRMPYAPVLLLTFALYVIKEWYPFSHFPMYSRLGNRATLVYVTDQREQPIAFRTVFGLAASEAKKKFYNRLGKMTGPHGRAFFEATPEEEDIAGQQLLDYLLEIRREDEFEELGATELRLYHRHISLQRGELVRDDRLVTTLKLP